VAGALIVCLLFSGVAGAQEQASDLSDKTASVATATNGQTMLPEEPLEQSPTAENEESTVVVESRGVSRDAMVVTGKNAELKRGETANVVVVIGGSAKIDGRVTDTVTVIGGNAEINGEVDHEVVAVMGNVIVGPEAKLHGDVVAAGGRVEVAPGGQVDRRPVEVDLSAWGIRSPEWVTNWLAHCVLMLRPLSFQVGWIWAVAAGFSLLYFLVALLFPRPVRACVEELDRRPATTFLLGLLTKLLVPLLFLLLIVTVIGILVLPFVIAALFLGTVVGKVALIEWFGLKLGRLFGRSPSPVLEKPLAAFLLGLLLITLLYLIPVIGLLTSLAISIWGLGAAVTAAFGGMRREMPERETGPAPSYPAPSYTAPVAGPAPDAGHEPAMAMASLPVSESTAAASSEPQGQAEPQGPAVGGAGTATAPPPPLPPVPYELAYPKASFWERMGAGFLDIVLVSILSGVVGGMPLGFFVAVAYFAGMWAWKGTTIGGIVLNLKVVRTDGEEVTFPVALVRALAGTFSLMVLFLGFIWIAWDPDKQGWHDRIAGTVVLRLPRGTPLVCF